MTTTNAHEAAARAGKVLKLASLVPAGETRAENASVAAELASWPVASRNRFARAVGAKNPSDLTWASLVAHVASRGVL